MKTIIRRVARAMVGACFVFIFHCAGAQGNLLSAGAVLATSAEPSSGTLPVSSGAGEPTQANITELAGDIQALRGEVAELRLEVKALKEAGEVPAALIKANERGVEALRAATVSSTAPVQISAAGAPAAGTPLVQEPPQVDHVTPYADANWGWQNGNARTVDCPLCSKLFTPEVRVDVNYALDFNHPKDDSVNGSSEIFRSQEVQLEQLGVGGDLLIDHVHARMMTQLGMYSVTTPRSDGSVNRGQWNLNNSYRYFSEAFGGYHWDKLHGINLDAGIFMSYIGLFSYYNFDNWAYQPSFVSSNTPWFFTGIRGQFFLTQHLKIEPWFVNGWQSYARYGGKPGLGGQVKWTPTSRISLVTNNYGMGEDDYGIENRTRFHTDDSVQMKYYERSDAALDRMAFTLTGDAGCEEGAGVACLGSLHSKTYIPASAGTAATPYYQQSFLGWMAYNRFWFHKDRYALTMGGGAVNNPGRYLVLLPSINGANASTGNAYFPEDPGQPFHGEDGTFTYDFMPRQFITYRVEYGYRHSDVPYWAGRGGSTPPGSVNAPIGNPGDFVCSNGTSSVDSGLGYTAYQGMNYASQYAKNISSAIQACSQLGYSLWMPDMRRDEQKIIFAILVKW
ncbi:MAG: outer membrane beta-barrel protein [Terracidiphilus sp.]